MEYDEEKDSYACKNGKELPLPYMHHSKSKTGYSSEKSIYQCRDCRGCAYKNECIKGNNCKTPMEEKNKVLSVARNFLKYRQEYLERILLDEGMLLSEGQNRKPSFCLEKRINFKNSKSEPDFRFIKVRYFSTLAVIIRAKGA